MSELASSTPGESSLREISILAVPAWNGSDAAFQWLWHGFSTRAGGVSTVYTAAGSSSKLNELNELNLGFTVADTKENVLENRFRFVEAITGARETPLLTVRQIHSNHSVIVRSALDGADCGWSPCDGDGLMTDEPGILIGIQTADCIPVLIADPVRRAVAAFHAGWRGTVELIVERGVAQMATEFGSVPVDLIAAIGPGIRACCYAVGSEVVARFHNNFDYATELFVGSDSETPRLNLIEANRRQLLVAGLRPDSVHIVGGCTSCNQDTYFSHRASGGHAGRMMSAIGIRSLNHRR